MNFTFVRTERSQEENQERAFIAASRRQDRDFKQRLESLQKASELHFARTGKRFEVTQAQVEHNGPLMEQGDRDRRRGAEYQRYRPYTVDRRRGRLRRDEDGECFTIDAEQQDYDPFPRQHPQSIQPHLTFYAPQDEIWSQELPRPSEPEPPPLQPYTGPISVPEIDVIESQSQNEVEETQNSDADELHPSFFETENWSEIHSLDIQSYLDMHFPTPREGTPDMDLHVKTPIGGNERTSPFVWTERVQEEEDADDEQKEEGYT